MGNKFTKNRNSHKHDKLYNNIVDREITEKVCIKYELPAVYLNKSNDKHENNNNSENYNDSENNNEYVVDEAEYTYEDEDEYTYEDEDGDEGECTYEDEDEDENDHENDYENNVGEYENINEDNYDNEDDDENSYDSNKLHFNKCAICLETEISFKKSNIVNISILSCQHIYHYKCIKQWLRRNDTCPTCRKIIK